MPTVPPWQVPQNWAVVERGDSESAWAGARAAQVPVWLQNPSEMLAKGCANSPAPALQHFLQLRAT